MAARVSLIGPLASGLLFICIIGVWFSHTSPWFMWGIVASPLSGADERDLTLFFDIPATLKPAVANLDARYQLSDQIPVSLQSVRRLAWRRGVEREMIAVVPTLGQGDTVQSELATGAWRYQRLGGLIVASRGNIALPSSRTTLAAGARELGVHLAPDALPFQPLALFSIGDIRAYVAHDRQQLLGVLRRSGAWPNARIARSESAPASGLELALGSQALAAIPTDILTRWQEELVNRFALKRSRPALVKELEGFDTVAAVLDADDVAIGARSASASFIQTAEGWLQAEQGYQSPSTVAFRLPDGTLGYEKRPSHAPITWQIVGDGACRTTTLAEVSYWLCRQAEAGALAKSESGARRVLAALSADTPWHVRLGATVADKLTTLPIVTAELQAAELDQIILRLDTAY